MKRYWLLSRRLTCCLIIIFLLLGGFPHDLIAGRPGRHSGPRHSSSTGLHRSTYATGLQRDSHGRIKRSEAAKKEFRKETGYAHGRKGYVIDHVVPLSKGGADSPSNMQWQTKADAKSKDKWERGRTHPITKGTKRRH